MKTVVLTGATGLIGQYAINPLLAENFTVHAVTSKPPALESTENLIWHQTDLLDAAQVKNLIESVRPTHLLHFAWYVEHQKLWNAVENLDWLQASTYLARQFAENGGERLVISGSCAEYDWTEESPFSENLTRLNPQGLYGASKHALNLVLEKFIGTSNVSYAWGRIFYLFGANESSNRLVPSVINALLDDKPAATSHGNQIRDFLFAEDVAKAFVALLVSKTEGTVNIGSGKGTKLKQIIEIIAEIIGKPELLRIGALPAQKNDPPSIVANITRLREEVGWQNDFTLTSKLEETIDWWKDKKRN